MWLLVSGSTCASTCCRLLVALVQEGPRSPPGSSPSRSAVACFLFFGVTDWCEGAGLPGWQGPLLSWSLCCRLGFSGLKSSPDPGSRGQMPWAVSDRAYPWLCSLPCDVFSVLFLCSCLSLLCRTQEVCPAGCCHCPGRPDGTCPACSRRPKGCGNCSALETGLIRVLGSAPGRSEGMWPLWGVRPRARRLNRCSGPLGFFIIWFVRHCIIFCGNFEVSVQIAAEDGSSERNPFPSEQLKTFLFSFNLLFTSPRYRHWESHYCKEDPAWWRL